MIFSADPGGRSRWLSSAAIVILLHGLAFAALFVHVVYPNEDETSPAIAIDMSPAPTAPPAPKSDDRPTKQMIKSPKALPDKAPKTKPLPFKVPPEVKIADVTPEVALPRKSDQNPPIAKPLPPAPETAPDASPNTVPDKKLAAPVTGGLETGKPTAVDIWNNKVLARIRLVKRYPVAARNLYQEDTVTVWATIDRSGKLISAKVDGSKGFPLLDGSAIEAVQRAAPFPKPPAEVRGDPVEIHVDLEYHLVDLVKRRD